MKILEQNKKQGEITVKVDNLNDLWSLYNVISKGDHVSARTQRRVVMREGTKGERKSMTLKLDVEDVSFHEFSNRLRIRGKILEGPEDYVSFGSYHTFNIETGHELTIIKEEWLKSELQRIREASKFESNFLMLFIAIETGLANIALITNYSQNKIATIKKHIPGKRYEQSHRNKALNDFFKEIRNVLEENLKNSEVSAIIICGPGNTRNMFINYLREQSNEEYLSTIRSCHASSGTESAILETLKSPELKKLKKKVKLLQESEKIEEILALLGTETDLIAIGFEEISRAAKRGAIKELFLTDKLIRGVSKDEKLRVEEILIDVENSGGIVNIFSSQHPSGERIIDLGNILGILRYKL